MGSATLCLLRFYDALSRKAFYESSYPYCLCLVTSSERLCENHEVTTAEPTANDSESHQLQPMAGTQGYRAGLVRYCIRVPETQVPTGRRPMLSMSHCRVQKNRLHSGSSLVLEPSVN